MKNFYKKHKVAILIVLSVCVAVVSAAVLAFALADYANTAFSDGYSSAGTSVVETKAPQPEMPSAESQPPEPIIPLVITSPQKADITVSESHYAITGTSDPNKPLIMNGNKVSRLESGEFSVDVELTPGNNTFTFEYNNESVTYIIRYNFVVIKSYAPYEKQTYEAGSSFVAVAYARVNSSLVTATFCGQTINLTPQPYEEGDEFTNFAGTFTLPAGNESNLDLGGVKFTGTCQGFSRSYSYGRAT